MPAYATHYLYQLVNHWQLRDLKMCLEGGSMGEKVRSNSFWILLCNSCQTEGGVQVLGPAPQMEIEEHVGEALWTSRPLA